MADRRQEGAGRPDGGGHQEGIEVYAGDVRDADSNGRHRHCGGGIVDHRAQDRRNLHYRHEYYPKRHAACDCYNAVGDQVCDAGGVQCRADRQECAEQHDHRPFNAVIHFPQREQAGRDQNHDGGDEGDDDSDKAKHGGSDRGRENYQRQIAARSGRESVCLAGRP